HFKRRGDGTDKASRHGEAMWSARGLINGLAVPFIALSARRNTSWHIDVFVSRKIVFYSTAVLAVGIYLLLVAVAGYYLKSYGGSWGGAVRTVVYFGASLVLLTLVVSSQARSRLRMFLSKHFYENKYEYGDVWLGLTDQLSSHDGSAEALYNSTIKAVTDILDSTGGALWYRDRDGQFVLGASWVFSGDFPKQIPETDPFIKSLEIDPQTIDLHRVAATYDSGSNSVPKYILELPRAWLVVPILHAESLVAFMIVAESRTNELISWEDRDLLNTVGRQVGSYIALLNTTNALTELRQFEAFNQLSAFLVHDLKNVVAQLSLVVRNSEKYRDNPEFIADSFTTISDAVNKMNRMLVSLKQTHAVQRVADPVDLPKVVEETVGRCMNKKPHPTLSVDGTELIVSGNSDAIASVVQHLVQNAQDATEEDGKIDVAIRAQGDAAIMTIADKGTGMDENFISTRLFKPFDTTKGKAGMGIGVYESRQLVTEMGGKLTVTSAVGEGTIFTISLPLLIDSQNSMQVPAPVTAAASK
ncbi:MAG: XrtA/PEP-CTERM system histidine kinase PrsK, partial [Pseudomonadota bacterium]